MDDSDDDCDFDGDDDDFDDDDLDGIYGMGYEEVRRFFWFFGLFL